ncbi:hypothetical protein QT971_16915 [Microcoleus sp. herbarium19]|uniref:hypothetical protein n=1 Tax=unclassified Microcoleus TaxID=2642155 RepID=UPI002FD10858
MREEGSSAADFVADVTDVTDVSPKEEGSRKKEVGSRKKEEKETILNALRLFGSSALGPDAQFPRA